MRRIKRAAIGATILLVGALSFDGTRGPARVVVATLAGEASAEAAPLESASQSAPFVPQRLSETGLYRADGSVDSRNRHFSPQYPLWSDGAAKSRWIRLPEGAKIDVTDVDAWRFPAGTTIWKEFAWNGRKVETRMIRAEADGKWTFASYAWTEDQTDAILAPAEGVPAVFEVAPGKHHSIPSVQDCNACHSSAPTAVLGFNALQLSDDRDPLAPHAEAPHPGDLTLATLVEEDRLAPPRPELVRQPPRIRESNPTARAAMGYLSANCGACHNSRGPLARLGFSLLHDAGAEAGAPEPARATAVGARGRFVVPGTSEESSRIVSPGAPELSAVLHRMKSRRPASQMPPLGTVIADKEAIALVQKWIEGEGMETVAVNQE